MGKLIVIEGLDGSGKATQSTLLLEQLKKEGLPVQKVSFPNYDSPASELVQMYLSGAFGTNPSDVNAFAASTFYAVDRYASWKMDWQSFYENEGIILADRYTTSNAIHQCAKLPQNEWKAYIDWLEDFEYNKLGIPKPNQVIYLDVDPIVSQKLLANRYHYDDNKKDIHEKDFAYLQQCRKAAMWCKDELHWNYILCSDAHTMKSIQEIENQIYSIVKEIV